ncbi:chorion peroxidase-like [Teleopsis dalmanni]|uniref:chorion peroxidase-like n=1 Tax=Teleopsis dalmanni TaxID=139649 RepID=UPI0018CE4D02|nr:chorion peroxidase-like [Teleopsis dalmanni]
MSKSFINNFICLFYLFIYAQYKIVSGVVVFDFPQNQISLNAAEQNFLSAISTNDWLQFVEFGVDSINKQKRLEENLLNAQVTVQNGSISHVQLLDCLPNSKAQTESDIAGKILKSSLYAYNAKCAVRGISGEKCEAYLSTKELPKGSYVYEKCLQISKDPRDGHHPFRRLLPANYKDGFYKMYSEDKLPAPRDISTKALHSSNTGFKNDVLDDKQNTLALVQWSQFIEHDLSKPVVTSMSNGYAIECCDTDNSELLPRYYHPACAPLLAKSDASVYSRGTCLNYVRSALAIDDKCTFGAAKQLNQATSTLDLSQLYGFTEDAQNQMRTFTDGKIKSTRGSNDKEDLLPMALDETHTFCALKKQFQNSTCFMAGDSRVNNNPFAIIIYTLFMRNHNQITKQLKLEHHNWDDERLFQTAKSINIGIYRRIVMNEWLPALLGRSVALDIMGQPLSSKLTSSELDISNEFAVAAIRFYYSMMPNELHNYSILNRRRSGDLNNLKNVINVLSEPNLFTLKDHIYKSMLTFTATFINNMLESLLQQRAMKMDATYVDSLILLNNLRPSHADILAFDIQRGRDHGLQGYVKYLEICENTKITSWKDLEKYINKEEIEKLKSVYSDWADIDLIVGGISEIPKTGSTVGTTFTCILAEQLSKIRQSQKDFEINKSPDFKKYETMNAAELLCANSDLEVVQENIFQLKSEKNVVISCDRRFHAL